MGDGALPPRSTGGGEGQAHEGLTRRAFLRDGSIVTVAVFASGPVSALGEVTVALGAGGPAFLSPAELATLRGLVDRFIPGRPEDTDEGAVFAGCAEAIDALLGAFTVDPPRIYAGAPFSDRAGSKVNHFEDFLALDPYERKAWRLRIEGSRGRAKLEFNGPVKGWQAVYREGLAALEAAAGGSFATLPGPARDLILRNSEGGAVGELIDVAFLHTLQFMYGAPEYGGNKDLLAWRYTGYAGDVQPRGWTRAEIEQPDPGSGNTRALDEAPFSLQQLAAIAPLGSPELVHGLLSRSGGSLRRLRAELAPVREAIEGAPDA